MAQSSGLCNTCDAIGRVTSFAYDPEGRVTSTTFPSTLQETYAYDALGNLLSKTDRKGQTLSYTHDALNRRVLQSKLLRYHVRYDSRSGECQLLINQGVSFVRG